MNIHSGIKEYLSKLNNALKNLDITEISSVTNILMDAYEKDQNIFVCGNGGSALTASHLACDFNKGACYGLDKRFKVISLTDNIGAIMAYSNDVSYECVFVEQLKNFFSGGDVVIGISGSGNSANIIKAIEFANEHSGITIGLTGYDGGKLKKISMYSINANIDDMQISEDIHTIISHMLTKMFIIILSDSESPGDIFMQPGIINYNLSKI